MILEDKWSWNRLSMLLVMLLVTGEMVLAVAFLKGTEPNDWIFLLGGGLLFFLLLAVNMEKNRLDKGILDEKAGNFARIALAYAIACQGIIVSCLFAPYLQPVAAASALMTLVSTSFIGLMIGIYCSILLVMTGEGSIYLLSCYCVLCICACVIVEHLQKGKKLLWGCFMMLLGSFSLITVFSYLDSEAGFQAKSSYPFLKRALAKLPTEYDGIGLLVVALFGGLIVSGLVVFLARVFSDKVGKRRDQILNRIMKGTYELALEMKTFSPTDYEHAKRVARNAGACAACIGADAKLAAAAGFYYRLGQMEGEPHVENGIKSAVGHGFLPELVQIIGEYNAEKYLPSTVESALVHMVDRILTKFELLDHTQLSSEWNKDMLIYQTLNEYSTQGIYDKSGLSMNLFLKVRDFLVKEADLF